MEARQLTTDQLVALFGPLIECAKGLTASHAEAASGPEGPRRHRRRIAWAFLFRSMNLADAAVEAARQRRGEALALIARSMLEMAFHVSAMKTDPSRMDTYDTTSVGGCLEAKRKYAACLEARRPNDPLLPAMRDAILSDSCKPHLKPPPLLDIAKAGGMEEEYRLQYNILCRDTHHDAWALEFYSYQTEDGMELTNVYPEELMAPYLRSCMTDWWNCFGVLAGWCQIVATSEFETLKRRVLEEFTPFQGNGTAP